MKTPIAGLDDFAALDRFFRIIERGLDGLAGPGHFFDLLAEDAVFEYVITVPGYPRRVEGRAAVAELYRPYGDALVLDRCYDLAVHHGPSPGHGRPGVRLRGQGRGHRRPLRQPLHLRPHPPRPRGRPLAGLPRPDRRLRRTRLAAPLNS